MLRYLPFMKKIVSFACLCLLVFASYAYRDRIVEGYDLVIGRYPEVEEAARDIGIQFSADLETLKREVITPEPLRLPSIQQRSYLTIAGVIAETNRHRAAEGLPPLTGNALLASAAKAKADDMFRQQYFAHESPGGIGAGDLVSDAGYAFVTIGENLALGNYADDTELVQAWMDSPGHRANILSSRFTEIGVAVVQGTYEGEKTWMAVQEFGRPLASCPSVDEGIQLQIDQQEKDLQLLSDRLDQMRTDLDQSKPRGRATQEEVDAYNEKVNTYNAQVAEYKQDADALKGLVEIYNAQVRTFNTCIAQ